MQKTAISAVLCLALSLMPGECTAGSGVSFVIDGAVLETQITTRVEDQTTYVSYWPIVQALYPDAAAEWANGRAEVRAEGLELFIQPGAQYIAANGRYLYVPGGVMCEEDCILVPVRILGQALGASVEWDGENSAVLITPGDAPITPGEQFYQSDVLYWLSHIINAESGNQPLEGKIAVGNVVLNRVASTVFPNTVYEVLFQRSQFTPAMTGSIYCSPNEESVIAAKLCLDGANTVGNALYFVNPRTSPSSWASRNRPYVDTIGAHAFFA